MQLMRQQNNQHRRSSQARQTVAVYFVTDDLKNEAAELC